MSNEIYEAALRLTKGKRGECSECGRYRDIYDTCSTYDKRDCVIRCAKVILSYRSALDVTRNS